MKMEKPDKRHCCQVEKTDNSANPIKVEDFTALTAHASVRPVRLRIQVIQMPDRKLLQQAFTCKA